MSKEIWKWAVGYEFIYRGYYKISLNQRVKSVSRKVVRSNGRIQTFKERILKQGKDTNGYPVVTLYKKGTRKTIPVHRLILETFVGPCPDGMECRHLNDNKTDNRWPENICWGTYSQNRKDAYKNGRASEKGDKNKNSKLSIPNVLLISNTDCTKKGTIERLAKMFGVSSSTIWAIKNNKTWRNTIEFFELKRKPKYV